MSRRSDALLALATLTLLTAISIATGTTSRLAEPVPAVTGVGGMLLLELLLVRFRQTTRRLWAQRQVRIVAVGCVLLGASGAVALGAAVVIAVLAWGLLGYLALLGGVVARERTVANRD